METIQCTIQTLSRPWNLQLGNGRGKNRSTTMLSLYPSRCTHILRGKNDKEDISVVLRKICKDLHTLPFRL